MNNKKVAGELVKIAKNLVGLGDRIWSKEFIKFNDDLSVLIDSFDLYHKTYINEPKLKPLLEELDKKFNEFISIQSRLHGVEMRLDTERRKGK